MPTERAKRIPFANRTQYTADSLERALDVHLRAGRLSDWDHADDRYVIDAYGGDRFTMTTRDALAFVHGLAVAARHAKAELAELAADGADTTALQALVVAL